MKFWEIKILSDLSTIGRNFTLKLTKLVTSTITGQALEMCPQSHRIK